jgi:hypothetical protein
MKKMKTRHVLLGCVTVLVMQGCFFEETDDQKPEIDRLYEGAFPVSCDTIYFGETFTFRALFTDNVELGSYSIDIHQNFDHHSHSTGIGECTLSPKREAVNPYQLTSDFFIPVGSVGFFAEEEIAVPLGDDDGPYDEGDYHLYIRLTDREGWSVQQGLSIKMLNR